MGLQFHEIGHTLGFVHSNEKKNITYPYYSTKLELDNDDVVVIQSLYGMVAASVGTAFTPVTEKDIEDNPEICSFVSSTTIKFLIVNQFFFIVDENLVWIFQLFCQVYLVRLF